MFTPLFLSLYFVKQVLVRRPFVVLVLKLGPCRVEVPCKRIGDLVWYDEEALNETEDTLTTPQKQGSFPASTFSGHRYDLQTSLRVQGTEKLIVMTLIHLESQWREITFTVGLYRGWRTCSHRRTQYFSEIFTFREQLTFC